MAHAEQGHPMPGNYHFDASERAWLDFLNEHGYVVLQGVVDADTVARARTSFWDAIETKNPGVDRADTESWELWQLDPRGIVCDGDLMHCQGAWTIRSHPSVRSAFASIWNDPSLIVSFDSPIMWRPWWLPQKEHWRPFCEGLHVDQNPFHKPDRCCVQGMVPLYDVSETTGGLAVVHQSHIDEARNLLKKNHPRMSGALSGDFCQLRPDDRYQGQERLLLASAGDLILWDSRTIHCGLVGTGHGSQEMRHAEVTSRAWQRCAPCQSCI